MVLFDHVGSDGSDLSAWSRERYSSLEGYARAAAEVCEALDLERAVFVGHSVRAMAGAPAARAGRATPDSSPGPGGVAGEGGANLLALPAGRRPRCETPVSRACCPTSHRPAGTRGAATPRRRAADRRRRGWAECRSTS